MDRVLKAARTSGFLNVSDGSLREVPDEVFKILNAVGLDEKWCEALELWKLIEANNGVESLKGDVKNLSSLAVPDVIDYELSCHPAAIGEKDSNKMKNALNEEIEENASTTRQHNDGDILQLDSSDQPCMMLVTEPLTGDNFLFWSRLIKIALRAKGKLGFINGKCMKPAENSEDYERWMRVDCMVTSWILNSISKEIVDMFLYKSSARDLWLELEQIYGGCNGLLLYQLHREIASISQGNMSVMNYFTRLNRLWGELACLVPPPKCICGSAKAVANLTSINQLMQFLVGLNDGYNQIRNQILLMDPLPSVNKAYSMILSVELQRELHIGITDSPEDSAMMIKMQQGRRVGNNGMADNKQLRCNHCDRTGHTKETCFKLHGYPEWYKC